MEEEQENEKGEEETAHTQNLNMLLLELLKHIWFLTEGVHQNLMGALSTTIYNWASLYNS